MTGGQRLKQAIHVAREQRGIKSDMQLSKDARISYDTLMNWYADRTVPRPERIRVLAKVLDVSYDSLMAAWEGREPSPPSVEELLADLTAEVHELVVRIDRLLTPRPEEDVARVQAALDVEQAKRANRSPPRRRARPTDGE